MYILCVPLLLIGMLTSSSLPSVNGMSLGRNWAGGTKCWSGEVRVYVSQDSLRENSVARLQIVSEIMFHLYGHAAPPNVRRRASNAMFSFCKLAQDWIAMLWWRWQRQYADLKSIFVARILLCGCFRLAATVQFTRRLMTQPKMHGESFDLSRREFTDEFDPLKTKL